MIKTHREPDKLGLDIHFGHRGLGRTDLEQLAPSREVCWRRTSSPEYRRDATTAGTLHYLRNGSNKSSDKVPDNRNFTHHFFQNFIRPLFRQS